MTDEIKTEALPRTDDTAPDVAAQMTGGENTSSDAGETKEDEEFDTLCKGRYKEAFGRRVSEIVRERLKHNKESTQKQEKVLTMLCDVCGIDDISALEQSLCSAPDERQLNALKAVYPDLSEDEMKQNRQFIRLTALGTDIRTAYEASHLQQITDSIRRAAYAEAESRILSRLRTNAARPSENGTSRRAESLCTQTVEQMSDSDIDDICRRVSLGERIVLH